MKKIVILFVLILLIVPKSLAVSEKSIIRVGISNNNFSTYNHKVATFFSDSDILISNMSDNTKATVPKNTEVTFNYLDGFLEIKIDNDSLGNLLGPFVLSSSSPIAIKDLKRRGKQATYEGQIEITLNKDNSAFNIINVLSMNSYLKGVVPNEMPVSFGLEALKAQAVAARNYANRDISTKNKYEICDSVACQVYFGSNTRNPISDRAVDETSSIYALWQGKPALTLYHSTSGGITEDFDNVYGNGDNGIFSKKTHPYLISVGKKLNNEFDIKNYYSDKPDSPDVYSPKYRWNYEFSEEELINNLNARLPQESTKKLLTPEFPNNTKITKIDDIIVAKYTSSGKALLLDIKTDIGTFRLKGEGAIRRIFTKNSNLPSANFYIEKKFDKSDTNTVLNTLKHEGKYIYVLTGGGFGHGVGMSQYGAYYFAKKGYTYDKILKYYYTGITLGTLPRKIDKYSDIRIPLYINKDATKKIIFKIDNSSMLNNFSFSINNVNFSPNMNQYKNKLLWFDFYKYLKNGRNEIIIRKLSQNDINKTAQFWIEIGE